MKKYALLKILPGLTLTTLVFACSSPQGTDEKGIMHQEPVEPEPAKGPEAPPLDSPIQEPKAQDPPALPTPTIAAAEVAPVAEAPVMATPTEKDPNAQEIATPKMPPDVRYTTSPAESQIQEGVNLMRQNSLFEARQSLQAATNTDPKSATAWYNLALVQFRTGSFDDALTSVQKAVEINPTYSRAVVLESVLYVRKHEAARAIDAVEKALLQRPLDVMLMSARARALVEDKQFQAAIDQCIKGIKLDQNNPELMRTLGEAYLAMGREGLARMALERAWTVYTGDAEAPPGADENLYKGKKEYLMRVAHGGGSWRGPGAEAIDRDAGMAQINYLYGMMALKKDEVENARTLFMQSVQQRPDYAEAWNNLGICWIIAKKPDEAIEALTKALEIEPTLLEARVNLGSAWRISKDPQKAEKSKAEFERALKQDPRNPAIHFNLAILFMENPMADLSDEARFQKSLEYFHTYRELRGSDTSFKNPGTADKKDPLDDYVAEVTNLLKIEKDKRKAKESSEDEIRKQKQEDARKAAEAEQKARDEEAKKNGTPPPVDTPPPGETPPPPGDTPPPPQETAPPPPPADQPAPPPPPADQPAPPPPADEAPPPPPP